MPRQLISSGSNEAANKHSTTFYPDIERATWQTIFHLQTASRNNRWIVDVLSPSPPLSSWIWGLSLCSILLHESMEVERFFGGSCTPDFIYMYCFKQWDIIELLHVLVHVHVTRIKTLLSTVPFHNALTLQIHCMCVWLISCRVASRGWWNESRKKRKRKREGRRSLSRRENLSDRKKSGTRLDALPPSQSAYPPNVLTVR